MAGAMNNRGAWGPMTNGLAATSTTPSTPAAGTPQARLVTDRYGRLPGLLLAWRQLDTGHGEGRVAHLTLDDDGRWDLVEAWLPTGLLDSRTDSEA